MLTTPESANGSKKARRQKPKLKPKIHQKRSFFQFGGTWTG